jgi:cystathionine beta-lyase
LGCCAGPDDVYQVLRGLRTMGVRLAHHEKSALDIARWLEGQPGVAQVLHPCVRKSSRSRSSGSAIFPVPAAFFSIVLDSGGTKQAHAFLDALEIFGLGYSWGGYESLAVHAYPWPIARS